LHELYHKTKSRHHARPGASPTIVSFNASAVKIYNATGIPVLLENKDIFHYLEKRSSRLQYWRSRRIGSRLQNYT
jgi:hypothetical protein